jgi:hypothetical protein
MMDFHRLKLGIENWDHKEKAGMDSEVPQVEQAWVLPSKEKDESKN